MKKLLLALIMPVYLFGQNTIGLPDVINFTRQTYGAGIQNWDLKQDKSGIMYFANNEGLLTYDGKNWMLYPLPNKTIVRSVEIGFDNRLYVGGQDEVGYFSPANNGKLQYHSLTSLITGGDKSFGDVWEIVSWQRNIFFRTNNRIFRLADGKMAVYKSPLEWSFLGSCNGKLYAHDYQKGLMSFNGAVWNPLFSNNSLPANDAVTSILAVNKDSAVVTTLKNGLFLLTNSSLTKIVTANSRLFENDRIYAATAINNKWMALASSSGGVYIIDFNGNIIQRFTKAEGLQTNNILGIFSDNQQNLWLGLDNGIDLIAYNSAIKQINTSPVDGSGYTAIINNNYLYAGTSSGLYSVLLQPAEDLSFSKGIFEPVNNAKGQTWGMALINNQLLLGKHEGAFVVAGNNAATLSTDPGFWNFVPLSSVFPAQQIVAGNYRGISFFDYKNGLFQQGAPIKGFTESSRFIAIDNNENIWVSHPYHGVYKIYKKDTGYVVKTYSDKNGLPSVLNNHVYKIKNEVLVATEKGVYIYNEAADKFEPSAFYKNILGNQSIRYLKDDESGNTWFIHEKMLGVIDVTGKKSQVIYLPELNKKMLSGFEFIYPVNSKNIFLGGEKGFYHINYEKYKEAALNLQVQIRNVRINDQADSLLFGGYYNEVNEVQQQLKENIPAIAHHWKTIRFEFASSLYTYQANLEYSFRLKGFDENWSEWTKRTDKEYTNLPEGKYDFEVKVRNNLGNESAAAVYSFTILPPWYQTLLAKILYFLIICGGIYFMYRWQEKKFLQQQAKHEEEQKKIIYIHELERNKTESELVTLRNEKLEAELNFKNSELASSAMHLVKKGELLSKVKGDLTQMMKRLENEQAINELKKMIKSLGEDENIDKEWENFAKHFDKVHSDFVIHLKEKHPGITPNELKLCAYLRMNLSTKEIAQLMNISVRGVEISRYRLRKKLGLNSETGLFDYLINLHG